MATNNSAGGGSASSNPSPPSATSDNNSSKSSLKPPFFLPGSSRLARRDEQLLALNYENLCDSDYLQRLFLDNTSSDYSSDSFCLSFLSDILSASPIPVFDKFVSSGDLSDDIALFGRCDEEFAQLCLKKRNIWELVSKLAKSLDHQSILIYRQVAVFDYIGKLVSAKYTQIMATSRPSKSLKITVDRASTNFSNIGLICALKVLEKQSRLSLQYQSIEPLLKLIFNILAQHKQTASSSASSSEFLSSNSIASTYIKYVRMILSNTFKSALLRRVINLNEINDILKTALFCVYSELTLGLYLNSSGDILIAISHFLAIITRFKEIEVEIKDDMLRSPGPSYGKIGYSEAESTTVLMPSLQSPNKMPVSANDNNTSITLVEPSINMMKLKGKGGPLTSLNDAASSKLISKILVSSSNSKDKESFADNILDDMRTSKDMSLSSLPTKGNKLTPFVSPVPSTIKELKAKSAILRSKNEAVVEADIAASNILVMNVSIPNFNNQVVKPISNPVVKGLHKSNNNKPILLNNINSQSNNSSNTTFNNIATKRVVELMPGNPISSKIIGKKTPLIKDKDVIKNRSSIQQQKQQQVLNSNNLTTSDQKNQDKLNFDEKLNLQSVLNGLARIPVSILALICNSRILMERESNKAPEDLVYKETSFSNSSADKKNESIGKTYTWSCGQNSYGELGHSDVTLRKSFNHISGMDDKGIINVSAGNEHSVMLTKDGQIYVCGYNDNGQCGTGSTQQVKVPTLVQDVLENEKIADIYVHNGCEHSLILTKEGKVYAFGYNYRGQLGLGGTNSEYSPRLVKSLSSKRVVKAACSYHHSLFLCSDGSIYASGRNDNGQLGLGDNTDKKLPQLVPVSPKGVIDMSAGQFHSALVTDSGEVYVCGKNDYGQLGVENIDSYKTFTKITPTADDDKIIQVSCGYYHTLLLSASYLVFGFGRNDYGQLGLGHVQPRVFTSTNIFYLRDKNVYMISSGCYHSVAITKNGMLYVCGRNNHGQLGTGDLEERHIPHPVDDFVGKSIVKVAAGFYHTLVLVKDNPSNIVGINSILSYDIGILKPSPQDNNSKDPILDIYKEIELLKEDKSGAFNLSANTSFSFENPTKLMLSDLLSFLIDKFYGLVRLKGFNFDSEFNNFAAKNVKEAAAKTSRAKEDSISGNIKHSLSHLMGSLNILKSISIVFGLCRGIISELSESDNILATDEAMKLIKTMVSVVDELFVHFHEDYSLLLSNLSEDDWLQLLEGGSLSELFSKPTYNLLSSSDMIKDLELSIADVNSHFHFDLAEEDDEKEEKDGISDVPGKVGKIIATAVIKIRLELFMIYCHTPCDLVADNSDLLEMTSRLIVKHFDVLFSKSSQTSQFFRLLSGYISNPNYVNRNDDINDGIHMLETDGEYIEYSRCLKLMSQLCGRYHSVNDICKLFNCSQFHGLLTLQQILSAFNFISMMSLERKFPSLLQNAANIFGKVLNILEHCITLFIKVALPLILTLKKSVDMKERYNDELYHLGITIISDIFHAAEQVVQYLLIVQPYCDDILCLFRNTSVLPSILPSILLYAISNVSIGSCLYELVTHSQQLIQSLQLLGKSINENESVTKYISKLKDNGNNSSNSNTGNAPMAGSKDSSNSSTSSQTSSAYAYSQSNNMIWWIRLVKLNVILISKMGYYLINEKKSKDSSVINPSGSWNNACLFNHNMWQFVYPPLTLSNIQSQINPLLALDSIWELLAKIRTHSIKADMMYRNLVIMNREKSVGALIEKIEYVLFLSAFYVRNGLSMKDLDNNFIRSHFASLFHRPTVFIKRYESIMLSIIQFVKHLNTKRSILLTAEASLSWIDILSKVFAILIDGASIVLQSSHRQVTSSAINFIVSFNLKATFSRSKLLWRKAFFAVICLNRWVKLTKSHLNDSGEIATIDFLSKFVDSCSNNLTHISQVVINNRYVQINLEFSQQSTSATRFIQGLSLFEHLIRRCSFLSMKSDSLLFMISFWCTKLVSFENSKNSDRKLDEAKEANSFRCCPEKHFIQKKNAIVSLLKCISDIISEFIVGYSNSSLTTNGSSEIQFISLSVNWVHCLILSPWQNINVEQYVPLSCLTKLMIILDEMSQQDSQHNSNLSSSMWNDSSKSYKFFQSIFNTKNITSNDKEKITSASSLNNNSNSNFLRDKSFAGFQRKPQPRDRVKAIKRAINSVMACIQDLSVLNIKTVESGDFNSLHLNKEFKIRSLLQTMDYNYSLCYYMERARILSNRQFSVEMDFPSTGTGMGTGTGAATASAAKTFTSGSGKTASGGGASINSTSNVTSNNNNNNSSSISSSSTGSNNGLQLNDFNSIAIIGSIVPVSNDSINSSSSSPLTILNNNMSAVSSTLASIANNVNLNSSIKDTILPSIASNLVSTAAVAAVVGSNSIGARRRCQDLIGKPMEFSRTQEGFTLQGDKLLSSYKGVDFTIAFWAFFAKKNVNKCCFITGKVSHNDAWPLLILRPDAKLEVSYGHGSEFEKVCSQSVISMSVWTHIAIVVEQKKIKVFINGILDSQVNIVKVNSRAILYPLIVGACPHSLRTRVDVVKMGFDGMLSQYKYYTRALSPIHVRVVFDQGPPDSYDFIEKWIYRLLSTNALLFLNKMADCSNLSSFLVTQSEFANSSICSYADEVFRRSADVSMFVFMNDNVTRVRCAAIQILKNILMMDKIYDINIYPNVRQNMASSQVISICTCGFLDDFTSFHEKFILFLIRLLGCCWSPHLSLASSRTEDYKPSATSSSSSSSSSVPIGGVGGIGFVSGSDLPTSGTAGSATATASGNGGFTASPDLDGASKFDSAEKESSFAKFREFISYSPSIILDLGSFPSSFSHPNNSSSAGGGGGLNSSNNSDAGNSMNEGLPFAGGWEKAQSRDDQVKEVSMNIMDILDSFCRRHHSKWSTALNSVLANILAKSKDKYLKKDDLSSFQKLDVLGASIFLGGIAGGINLGMEVFPFYSDVKGVVLNVNKSTNNVTVLTNSSLDDRYRFMFLRHQDITVKAFSPLPFFNNVDVASEAINLLESLVSYNKLIVHDSLCQYNVDHPLLRLVFLRSLRPVESFYFHQLLSFLSNQISDISSVSNISAEASSGILSNLLSKSILMSFIKTCAVRTVLLQYPEKNNVTDDHLDGKEPGSGVDLDYFSSNASFDSRNISYLWSLCFPYIASIPDKAILTSFVNEESTIWLNDFNNRHLCVEPILAFTRLTESYNNLLFHTISSSLSSDDNFTSFKDLMISNWSAAAAAASAAADSKINSNCFLTSNMHPFSALTELDKVSALKFIGQLRRSIVFNSRKILALMSIKNVDLFGSNNTSLIYQFMLVQSIGVTPTLSHAKQYGGVDALLESWIANPVYFKQIINFTLIQLAECKLMKKSMFQIDLMDRSDLFYRILHWCYYIIRIINGSDNEFDIILLLVDFLLPAVLNAWNHNFSLLSSSSNSLVAQPPPVDVYNYEVTKLTLVTVKKLLHLINVSQRSASNSSRQKSVLAVITKNNVIVSIRSSAHELLSKNHRNTSTATNSPSIAYEITQLSSLLDIIQRDIILNTSKNLKSVSSSSVSVGVSGGGGVGCLPSLPLDLQGKCMTPRANRPLSGRISSGFPMILTPGSTDLSSPGLLLVPSGSLVSPGLATPSSAQKLDINVPFSSIYSSYSAQIVNLPTLAPSLCKSTSSSFVLDLSSCGENILNLLKSMNLESDHSTDLFIAEIALAPRCDIDETPQFETIYNGVLSKNFTYEGLLPKSLYQVNCRINIGTWSTKWSEAIEVETKEGILFKFDPSLSGPDISISDNGLVASYQGDEMWSTILGSQSFTNGFISWSVRINQSSTAYIFIGVASSAVDLTTFLGGCGNGWGFIGEQALYHNREKFKIYGDTFSAGDVIGVTLNLNEGVMSFSKNSKSLGIAFDKVFGELYPAVAFYNKNQELEILPQFSITGTSHPISISPFSNNSVDMTLITEFISNLYTEMPMSNLLLSRLTVSINNWLSGNIIRCRSTSGKYVFLYLKSPLLVELDFIVGERIRTPFGIAEVAGAAYERIWFRFSDIKGVWHFSQKQIMQFRQRGYFLRCSYYSEALGSDFENNNLNHHINSLLSIEVAKPSAKDTFTSPSSKSDYKNIVDIGSPETATNSAQVFFDPLNIQDYVESSCWSKEMDSILLSFLVTKGDVLKVSPWNISAEVVLADYRNVQQKLSKVVINSVSLTHKWGISGPKRRAVLARVGTLLWFNHILEQFLPKFVGNKDISNNSSFQLFFGASDSLHINLNMNLSNSSDKCFSNKSSYEESGNQVIVSTHFQSSNPIKKENAFNRSSFDSNNNADQSKNFNVKLSSNNTLSSDSFSLNPLGYVRYKIFPQLKMAHFWESMENSTVRTSKTEDDYDYPEDLPQVKINRLKSFRAREVSETMLIPGEDLYFSSMFYQLWKELRQFPTERLRISYAHPMDDGQTRTFKIKFDGEGVDDYGGPYREILQQICDELQFPDPSLLTQINNNNSSNTTTVASATADQQATAAGGGAISKDDSSSTTAAEKASYSEHDQHSLFNRHAKLTAQDNVSVKCFIPLLIPTLNWNAGECEEKYKYTFNPGSRSEIRMDLYKFLGQILGIAIRSKITLDLALPSLIWKCVLGEHLSEVDLASIDKTAFDTVCRLLIISTQFKQLQNQNSSFENADMETFLAESKGEIQDINWTVTYTDGTVVDLVPGGSEKYLEISDIDEYVQVFVEKRLSESYYSIQSFKAGILSVVPEYSLTLLTWQELEHIVCGVKIIDVDRLASNTEYDDDLSADDPLIMMFWDVLRSFSEDEKSAFLRFVWARPTLPPKEVDFSQKFKIQSGVGEEAGAIQDSYLPKAHTCFFSINIPRYSTKEILCEKLRYAIFNCTEMDADFRLTDLEVAGWASVNSLLQSETNNNDENN